MHAAMIGKSSAGEASREGGRCAESRLCRTGVKCICERVSGKDSIALRPAALRPVGYGVRKPPGLK